MQSMSDTAGAVLTKFSLRALFRFITICCILAALAPVIGAWSATFLMLSAAAIAARLGIIAVACLAASVLVHPPSSDDSIIAPFLSMAIAAGLGLWFRWRTAVAVATGDPFRRNTKGPFHNRTSTTRERLDKCSVK